jgi:cell pole-organizing protein PopZ
MRLAGEPSVDEILDSIKKVIARDDRANVAARQKVDAAVLPASDDGADDGDVLDLAVSGRFLASGDEPDLSVKGEEPAAAPLVTAESRAAMRESLAALAIMAEPSASPQIVRSGETSLEQLTRELLRPALAEWLDQHLPAMVEKLVANEIARIVGKKS